MTSWLEALRARNQILAAVSTALFISCSSDEYCTPATAFCLEPDLTEYATTLGTNTNVSLHRLLDFIVYYQVTWIHKLKRDLKIYSGLLVSTHYIIPQGN